MIRFQKRVDEWIKCARDVEIVKVERRSTLVALGIRFLSNTDPNVSVRDLVELMDGFRVVAVGRVVEVDDEKLEAEIEADLYPDMRVEVILNP